MDLKGRKSINKAVLMWVAAGILLLIMATPALSVIFAAPGSVNALAIVNGAVKTKKIAAGAVKSGKIAAGAVNSAKIADGSIAGVDIANGVVNSAKIADGSITNADVAAGAAIAASKINSAGLNADTLDGLNSTDFVAKTGNQTMAGVLTATGLAYGTPQTRYLSIPASAFSTPDSTVTFEIDATGDYLYSTASGWNPFRAAVHLPDGANVTNFRMIGWDSLVGNYSEAQLERWSSGAGTEQMAGMITAGSTAAWQTINDASIATPVIDNSTHNYFAKFYHGNNTNANIRLGGIIITYTVPKP